MQDMVNRRISMKIIVELAETHNTRQFILLTPQSLVFAHFKLMVTFVFIVILIFRSTVEQNKKPRRIEVKIIRLNDPVRNQGTIAAPQAAEAAEQ